MSTETKTRIGLAVSFALVISGAFVADSAPAWLRYTIAGILALGGVALALLLAGAIIRLAVDVRRNRDRKVSAPVREVHRSTGIQILATSLSDDERGKEL